MPESRPRRAAPSHPVHGTRIRRAVAVDHAGLVELENQSFSSDRLSARQWTRHLASDSARVLVAVHARQLIGAAVLFFRRGSDITRLYSLAIHVSSRGLGIGNALLDSAEQLAIRRSSRRMRLEVREDNVSAQALYLRRGYRLIGRRAGYYEDGEDALCYEKLLG